MSRMIQSCGFLLFSHSRISWVTLDLVIGHVRVRECPAAQCKSPPQGSRTMGTAGVKIQKETATSDSTHD